jgi:hypothetical protein
VTPTCLLHINDHHHEIRDANLGLLGIRIDPEERCVSPSVRKFNGQKIRTAAAGIYALEEMHTGAAADRVSCVSRSSLTTSQPRSL